ncbi:hypothetical protein [Paraburkholderia phenoliruptrix]|uniref:hypothetical protein n=1 Tax=Paraburkholderia phenoliruptrix TaxID=252970 RepID=UPI0034CF4291
MNTSMHFVISGETALRRTARSSFGAVDSEAVLDWAAMPRMTSPASASRPPRSRSRAWDEVEVDDQGLPPTHVQAECGEREPRSVLFLNAPDSPHRTEQLHSRSLQLAGRRCHKLLLIGTQNGWGGLLRAVLAALRAAPRGYSVSVGVDGIDQQLTSPNSTALLLAALLDAGATIICSVDGRYGDAYLLKSHLRTLGITVMYELSARLSAGRSDSSGAFPASYTPTTKVYALRCSRSAIYGQQGRAAAVRVDGEDNIDDMTFGLASEVRATVDGAVRVICAANCTEKVWRDFIYAFRCAGLCPIEAASPVPVLSGIVHAKRDDEAENPACLFPRVNCTALKAYRHPHRENAVDCLTAVTMRNERGRQIPAEARNRRCAGDWSCSSAVEALFRPIGDKFLADYERQLREQFATAYRNPFAISRLLAERNL